MQRSSQIVLCLVCIASVAACDSEAMSGPEYSVIQATTVENCLKGVATDPSQCHILIDAAEDEAVRDEAPAGIEDEPGKRLRPIVRP